MDEPCTWPAGTCACYAEQAEKDEGPDHFGRVWMHCDEGLNLSKASMGRFLFYCLSNDVEIGTIHPFAPAYPRSQVSVPVRLKEDQFKSFEDETGGKLKRPPKISLN